MEEEFGCEEEGREVKIRIEGLSPVLEDGASLDSFLSEQVLVSFRVEVLSEEMSFKTFPVTAAFSDPLSDSSLSKCSKMGVNDGLDAALLGN
jgi:hypothetical protein